MNILVCAPDVPYPANRGGRADIWRRILAFRKLGHRVMLLNLYEEAGHAAPTSADWAHIDSVMQSRYSFPIRRGALRTLRQLADSRHVPWHVANRVPDASQWQDLREKVKAFSPDALWLDGPWFGEVAKILSNDLAIPLLYRSHNVEFRYLWDQAGAAKRLRNKVAWRLACVGLERYELDLQKRATTVFDISVDDLQYWKSRGVDGALWLPPLPELALHAPSQERIPSDLLFMGNLRTPNNILGVTWLVQEVLPLIRKQLPSVRLSVVGSMPDPELRQLLSGHEGVDVYYDVADVTPYLFGANVLLNPVPVGSGVQVKMLDMLMTPAPIISRPQGLKGLPAECATQFDVADDPAGFAALALRRLRDPGIDGVARAHVRRMFSVDAVGDALMLGLGRKEEVVHV